MRSIGAPVRRVGGIERVTGLQKYVGDLRLEDTLHLKLVHLPCARARIRSVRSEAAWKVPGVVGVFTAADLPQPVPRFGPAYRDRPVLAVGETKFHGEPVAAVVAETLDAAEQAAALVQVDYEELPAVLTVEDALRADAPLVQDPDIRTPGPLAETNILEELRFGWGEVDGSEADVVVEGVYTFPMVTHFAIEPHGFMAAPEGGGVTVWSSIQHPYLLQRVLSEVLQLPLAKVRVISPDPGGAFGGKGYPKFEPLVALLALRLGRPVRLVLTLEETFQAVRRSSARITARTGFRLDGTIVFHDVVNDFLIGAYADIAPRVVGKSSYLACGPYRVPNARVVARAILSHTPPSTAFRGFGTPQNSWAYESQMDEAARRLGIDRLEIRMRNLARRGEEVVRGDKPADGDWVEVVETAAKAIGWGTPLEPNAGRGIAVGIKASATAGASYALVRLLYDGSLVVTAGTSDMGQGARTVLSQIAGEELGIPIEQITVVSGDTAIVPFDYSTSASRSTVFMGRAVLNACQEVKRQLQEMLQERFGTADCRLDGDHVVVAGRRLSMGEAVREVLGAVRGEVIGVGWLRGEQDPSHPLGGSPSFYEFSCTAAEVQVDPDTGELLISKLVVVGDIGKALNPQHVHSQDEGATVMGLGHTLMEQLIFDEAGRIRNLGALDYRVPTIKDLPVEMQFLGVENQDGPGPYGAKGVGEGALLATSPAIASAVAEATGVVIRSLPLTPEAVWRAVKESR